MCLVEQLLNTRPLLAQTLKTLMSLHSIIFCFTVQQFSFRLALLCLPIFPTVVFSSNRNSILIGYGSVGCHLIVTSLVWIIDSKSAKGCYPLARVETLHFEDDGGVRPATDRTKSNLFARPVVKLVPLPVGGSRDQELAPGC